MKLMYSRILLWTTLSWANVWVHSGDARAAEVEQKAMPAAGVLLGVAGRDCREAALEQMLMVLHQCQSDPAYLANLGYQLNTLGRFADAMDHLERALMLDPDLKGARIDYALALAGVGEDAAALVLIDELLADPGLPPALAPQLNRQRRRLLILSQVGRGSDVRAGAAPTQGETLQWRKTASIRMGRDSNLLGAPNLASLTLTLPEGALSLPLDDSFRARAGAYMRADAGLEASIRAEGGVLYDVALNLQAKNSPAANLANSRQYELFGERNSPALPDGSVAHYVQLSLGGLDTNSGVHYRVFRAAGGGEWPGLVWALKDAPCNTRLGVEWQRRQLSSTSVLSGDYVGATGLLRCVSAGAEFWQIAAQWGQDWPHSENRPGGRQALYGLRFTGLWSIRKLLPVLPARNGTDTLLLDLEYGLTRDNVGYSALLASGVPRRIARGGVRLEWQHTLDSGVQAFAAVQWLSQSSNISLFQQQSWTPYVGVRVAW